MTETLPVPREPRAGLPSTESGAIQAAQSVADAMLDDETDADPLAIKNRAQAAIHLCDERNWPDAKREFAYAAICCEFRWTRENPANPRGRPPEGTDRSNSAPISKLSPRTAHNMRRAYADATPETLRNAKAQADEAGKPVSRRDVREQAGPAPDRPPRSALVDDWRAGVRKVLSKDRNTLLASAISDRQAKAIAKDFETLAAYISENGERPQPKRPGPKPASRQRPKSTPAPARPPGGRPPASDMPDIPPALDRRGRPPDYPPKHTPVGEAWHDYATAYRAKHGDWPVWSQGQSSRIAAVIREHGRLYAKHVLTAELETADG